MWGVRDVALNPVAPAAWVTLADAKAFLGVTDAAMDARISAVIAAACLTVENYIGAIVAQRTVTEILDTEDAYSTLVLRYRDIQEVTSLSKADVAETLTDYRLLKGMGALRRLDGACFEPTKWTAVYTAGYPAGDIPAAITEATLALIRALYNSKGLALGVKSESVDDIGSASYGADSFTNANGTAVPLDVAAMLGPYVQQVLP